MVHELELYNTEYYLGMFMNSFAVFQVCIVWKDISVFYYYEPFYNEI